MKIKSIKLKGFRRFKNLTIKDMPEEARLVVMIGPNGSGKSSVFDALLRLKGKAGRIPILSLDSDYIRFGLSEGAHEEPKVEFHTESPDSIDGWVKSVHVRSAYRNDLMENRVRLLTEPQPLTREQRFQRLSANDQAVATNYSRVLNRWIERGSSRKESGEDIDKIEDEIYGELRNAIEELFKDPQLILTGLGSPKDNKIFKFNKGTSSGLSYENLSSGEKAALDLILDIIVCSAYANLDHFFAKLR